MCQWLARCQVIGAGCWIRQNFMHSPESDAAYWIFGDGWANASYAGCCNNPDHYYENHHFNSSICSAGWTGLHVIHQSSCTDIRDARNPSDVRSCGLSVPNGLDAH